MDELTLREIESQLALDSELLFRMLGAQQGVGSSRGTNRDGKDVYENIKRSLRVRICTNRRVQTLCGDSATEKTTLVAAVLDCISGPIIGISPITVSVLLVKEGLNNLCADQWSDES
ncbi:hypothetical protein [Hyphococcus sp.]|uniref:hypothetical protein n=1 Tax=Hyphococcus sp. TaxID=2038636 RepID=UPI0035C6D624